MEIDKTKYENCTYVFGGVMRPLPKHPVAMGWVEIGGDPANPRGTSVMGGIRTQKKRGLFAGYSIQYSEGHGSPYNEVDSAFTLARATGKVQERVRNLATLLSQELNLPVVDYVTAEEHRSRADRIAVERMHVE